MTILGNTLLEWHSADDLPDMHTETYEGDTWLQSEPLLLADESGQVAMGYCHKTGNEEKEFEVVSLWKVGSIRAWALIQKMPLPGAAR